MLVLWPACQKTRTYPSRTNSARLALVRVRRILPTRGSKPNDRTNDRTNERTNHPRSITFLAPRAPRVTSEPARFSVRLSLAQPFHTTARRRPLTRPGNPTSRAQHDPVEMLCRTSTCPRNWCGCQHLACVCVCVCACFCEYAGIVRAGHRSLPAAFPARPFLAGVFYPPAAAAAAHTHKHRRVVWASTNTRPHGLHGGVMGKSDGKRGLMMKRWRWVVGSPLLALYEGFQCSTPPPPPPHRFNL